jgi:hypothetical protein
MNYRYTIPSGHRVVAQSVWVRFPTLPTTNATVLVFDDNFDMGLFYLPSEGKFALTGGATLVGPPIFVDTWYLIDYELDTTADPWRMRCRIDGGQETLGTVGLAAADITSVGLGTALPTETFNVFYSAWASSITDGDYPLGVADVERLWPNSDGTHNITTLGNFDNITTAFDNATTDSYLNIQDMPLNTTDTADNIIRQDASDTSGYVEHFYNTLAAGNNDPVDVRAYCYDVNAAAAATGNILRLLLPADASVTPDIRLATDDPGTTVTLRKKMMDRPTDGWTRGNVDGLHSRWGFGDGTPAAHLLGVMLEVAMVPHIPLPAESVPARRSMVA